jgi:hypothetical protein
MEDAMEISSAAQRALDIVEIQTVISLYSMGQDSHQGGDNDIRQQWDQAFAPDGTTDYSVAGAPKSPYQDLAKWMRGENGNPGRMSRYAGWQHMLSIPIIRLDGDTARARTDYMAVHKLRMEGEKGERFDALGAFHDDLVRTDAGWRIKHRRLEVYFGAAIETHGETFETKSATPAGAQN